MPEANDAESRGHATLSTERRRLIGQAIIDGVLTPGEALFLPIADYDQTGGNYTQHGNGNYTQNGGGNYDQGSALRFNIGQTVQ